jgi:hypothetical protein
MALLNRARWARPLLAAGIAVAALSAGLPGVSHAAPPSVRVLSAAAAASLATYEQKLAVAVKFGRGDDAALIERADRDFVIELWKHLKDDSDFLEVRAAAEEAYGTMSDVTNPDATDQACYAFITTGVFAAYDRDVARQKQEADAKRQRDLARTAAAASIDVVADAALLGGTDADFVRLIWERVAEDAKWPKVKAAARVARDGSDTGRRQFIAIGMAEAAKQDTDDRIAKDEAKTEAQKAAELARAAKKLAANRIGLTVTDELLSLPDRDFIIQVWNHTPDGSEVQSAAIAAIRSSDPVVWKAFIDTGVHQAKDRDLQIALDKRYQADKARAEQIKATATENKDSNLLYWATKALAGTPTELDDFVRIGQYDLDLNTSFETGDVPLAWEHSPAWANAVQNVNACSLDDTQQYKDRIAEDNRDLATYKVQLASLRAALATEQAKPPRDQNPVKIADYKSRIAQTQSSIAVINASTAKWTADAAKCAAKKPENSVVAEKAHSGSRAVRYFGVDHSTTKSHAYFRALALNRVTAKPTTKLTYWVYPQDNSTVSHVLFYNSTCVAIDLTLSGGGTLRDSGATDQSGNRAHAAQQCGKLTPNTWNKVEVKLGGRFDGQAITALHIAYDQPANTGGFRGYVDDISITD